MNKTALLFGVGASLILAAGTASAAGSCGAQVAELQQKIGLEQGANATIGATDPGVQQPAPEANATTGTSTTTTNDQVAAGTANQDNSANATIGATDPGVQQPAPEANATTGTSTTTAPTNDQVANTDNSANATIGATDPGVQQPAPEANATTGTTTTTDGSTTTADSSSSSTTTMPSSGTVEETSRVGDLSTSAGGHAEAITALKKAQMAADAGDESTCMTELGTAKAALGVE